jgi:hypothetical protein
LLGKRNEVSWDDTAFQAVSRGRVLIFSKYWKLFSLATGKLLPSVGPRNTKLKSIYSPDLKYYLCAEPDDDPTYFALYRTADGKRVEALPKMFAVYNAVWSPKANRFAMVGVLKSGASAIHHLEELITYSVR